MVLDPMLIATAAGPAAVILVFWLGRGRPDDGAHGRLSTIVLPLNDGTYDATLAAFDTKTDGGIRRDAQLRRRAADLLSLLHRGGFTSTEPTLWCAVLGPVRFDAVRRFVARAGHLAEEFEISEGRRGCKVLADPAGLTLDWTGVRKALRLDPPA